MYINQNAYGTCATGSSSQVNRLSWRDRHPSGERFHTPWTLVTALLLVTSGQSGLGVSRRPCCLAVGHCLVPCDPVSDIGESLGQGSLPTSLLSFIWVSLCFAVFAACCTLSFCCQWLQGFGAFLRIPCLLHSEYKWPGFCCVGCNRRVSARFAADESEAAA